MKLQTKSGASLFNGLVQKAVEGFSVAKDNGQFVAISEKSGNPIGVIVGETVTVDGKKVKLDSLVPSINPADLVGKDPTTLSKEELIILTEYLQGLAGSKAKVSDSKDATEKTEKAAKKKAKKAKPEPEVEVEEEETEEAEKAELPDGIESIEDLDGLKAKELWAIAKPLEIEGITSRSKKDALVEALAEYFDLEEEEDEEIESDELPEDMQDDEEEYDEEESDDEDEDEEDEDEDEEEDEDDEEEEDDEDESDEEEDDEDEDEEEEDEDYDDDEEEDDELTPEDIDNMETKEEIMAVIKQHKIKLPKKKLSVMKVKKFIKDALFGDDE
jgi:hypothetical protein